MSRTLVTGLLKSGADKRDKLLDGTRRMKERLHLSHPDVGFTLWARDRFPDQYLLVMDFPTEKDAAISSRDLGESRFLDEIIRASDEPMDVVTVAVHRSHGLPPHEMPENGLLSLSERVSGPGLSTSLVDDLDQIFEELQAIGGCLGWVYGSNASLNEEFKGIVLWDTAEAFVKSLPDRSSYEVNLYKRLL